MYKLHKCACMCSTICKYVHTYKHNSHTHINDHHPLGEGFTGTLREGKEVTVRVRGEDNNWVANRLGNIGITGKEDFYFKYSNNRFIFYFLVPVLLF